MASSRHRFPSSLVLTWCFKMSGVGRFRTHGRAAARHCMCDVDRGHLERWSSVTVHELSLREDVALVRCHCHVKPCVVFFFLLTQRQPQPSQQAAAHISVLFSVDVQIRDERCLSDPLSCYRHSILFFHWQAVCLFVVMSLFLFNHSGCFWVFFASFYRQHASTNATMVFKANCDVHYFHCCLILFGLFSSRIDWQANSPPFFLCCDLCSPFLSFRSLLPSVNLQY